MILEYKIEKANVNKPKVKLNPNTINSQGLQHLTVRTGITTHIKIQQSYKLNHMLYRMNLTFNYRAFC